MSAETVSTTDPRHPLQMDLSAAAETVRKWRGIAASTHDDAKYAWARANLAYHEGRVEGLKRRIAAAQAEQPLTNHASRITP